MLNNIKQAPGKNSMLTLMFLVAFLTNSCDENRQLTQKHAEKNVHHNLKGTGYKSSGFYQEYHEAYPIGNNSTYNDVRSIAVDSASNVWIASAAGVFFKKPGEKDWNIAIKGTNRGPAYSVIIDDESMWAGTWNGVYHYENNQIKHLKGLTHPISVLCPSKEGMYALGPKGVWLFEKEKWKKKDFNIARSVRDAISDKTGGLWVATDVGLYHCTKSKTTIYQNEEDLLSCNIQGLALDPAGRLWAGGLGGITIRKKRKKVKTLTPKGGLPSVFVRSVDQSPDDVMWVGTDVGVVRYYDDGRHSLRFSRRWLLDDHVRDVTFDKEGTAWIATAGGVSAIRKKLITLADKADYFYEVMMRRHIRSPWIAGQCKLKIPGDTISWMAEDDDNDGQYTAMYLAMESLRFAVTSGEDAHEKANKAFNFLKYLREVTESKGFIARTIVPIHWNHMHDRNRTFTPEQIVEEQIRDPRFKPVSKRWRRSKNGYWWWKGDTSSDELTGHMFGYFFYHLLAANDEEKSVVGDHIKKIVDYLIQHDYNLVDIDSAHTHWGVWSPDILNHDPDWEPEKGINSLELLSYLKLAYKVTGDEVYQNHYMTLIKKHHYMKNVQRILHSNPAWVTYIDPELIFLAFPPLILYETDENLKAQWEQLLDNWYSSLIKDESPFYNMMYSFLRNNRTEVDNSIKFLIDTPLDLIDWPIDHSKREDIDIVRSPVLESLQTSELQPPSLRAVVRWDKNPWEVIGGNPTMEREPVFWLLPYWLGKYIKIIP